MRNDNFSIIEAVKEISGQALTMPLSKRMMFDEVTAFRKLVLSPYYDLFIAVGKENLDAARSSNMLKSNDGVQDLYKQRKFTSTTIASVHMLFRLIANNSPTFTVSPALNLLLEDTGVKDNIPSSFFRPPYSSCFIEFEPAEHRAKSDRVIFSGGMLSICEGAIVQESQIDNLRNLRAEVREELELDPNKPARIIEVGFSSSPVNHPLDKVSSMPAAFDNVDIMTIYIQDEDELISDVIDRHLAFYEKKSGEFGTKTTEGGESFSSLFRKNFMQLTKIIFYLNIDRKTRRIEKEETELRDKISLVADKKKAKLKKQLQRVYDRIIVGPDTYAPIAQDKPSDGAPNSTKGGKSLHYRRGYFGIRWKGTGQAKLPELVHVSAAVINKHLLSPGKQTLAARDYEIR